METRKISVKVPAKINLFLDVVRREKKGFHKIITIFQAVSIFDRIVIRKSTLNKVIVNNKSLKNKHNIVEDAVRIIKKKYQLSENFIIKINKKIPIGAGLAGGSADAAAVLWGINKLHHLDISYKELICMGKKLGKDVPFFFHGGMQIGRNYGDVLSRVSTDFNYYILIIYPDFEISTKESYKGLKVKEFNKGKNNFNKILFALQNKKIDDMIKNLYNVFEKNAFKKHPVLMKIKRDLMENGVESALMSGTGSAVYGITKDKKKAKEINKKLKLKYKNIILLKPFYNGLLKM